MESGLFNDAEVESEAKRHNDYLNSAIGLLSFSLGLTCLGFENPQKAALFCVGILLPVFIQAWNHFPPTIRAVRQLAKETNDPHVIAVQNHLESKYLGFSSLLTKSVLYWYGLGFFLTVLFFPEVLVWVKT